MISLGIIIGLIFTIYIEIRTPWWRRHRYGGPITWKEFDDRIRKPAKRVTPPRIFRQIFDLPNGTINIVTFLNLIKNVIFILIAIVLIPFCFILEAYEVERILGVFLSVFAPFWFLFAVFRMVVMNAGRHQGQSASGKDDRRTRKSPLSMHSSSTAVCRLFEKHFDDFERMKDIVLQEKMSSTVFSKKDIVLNYSHLTRCKKYFTSEDYAFALDFYEEINPFYIDVENGDVRFDFLTKSGEPPMILWSYADEDADAFRVRMGEDSAVQKLRNNWYMVIYE